MGVSTWERDLRRIGCIQGTNEKPVADRVVLAAAVKAMRSPSGDTAGTS